MAFDFAQETSATVGTTELSMPANTTTGVPTSQTDTCQLQPWINIPSLAAGDEFLVQLYEKIISTGAQRVIDRWRIQYPIANIVLPAMVLHIAWDLTIKKIAGTDRVVEWSMRKIK